MHFQHHRGQIKITKHAMDRLKERVKSFIGYRSWEHLVKTARYEGRNDETIGREHFVLGQLAEVDVHVPGNTMNGFVHFLLWQPDRGLTDDVAHAVPDQHLHRDAGIGSFSVGHVHEGTGDAVGDFVDVLRIYFFVHNLPSCVWKEPRRPAELSLIFFNMVA